MLLFGNVQLSKAGHRDTHIGTSFSFLAQVTVGPDRLEQRLEVQNTGNAPLQFTTALHTYFNVASIHNVSACFS